MTNVARTFNALLGEACGGLEWESHLELKLSFGTPRMSFIEPRESNARTERVRRLSTFRITTLRGDDDGLRSRLSLLGCPKAKAPAI